MIGTRTPVAAGMAMAVASTLLLAACGDNLAPAPPADAAPDAALPVERVLFLGNSYTGVNDLPGVLAKLSASAPSVVRFEVGTWAPGGQTWEGHDADPMVDALIAQGWDDVVLQDQSEQAWFVSGIKPALLSLDRKIDATGARTVLYMTWARALTVVDPATRFVEDMALARYYERHAEAAGALVAPVGRAWERALRDPSVTLHAEDGSHPNAQGTYLAACVFYATLTGRDPAGLADGGLGLAGGDVARLQRIAWETREARRAPAPPRVGDWPLAAGPGGNDLVLLTGVELGDAAGPGGGPGTATTFGPGQFAAVPYRAGNAPAHVTVELDAALDDWSVPGGAADAFLAGRYDAWSIARRGTDLRAELVAGDDDHADTATLTIAAAALAPGWHHLRLDDDGQAATLSVDGAPAVAAALAGPLRYGGSAGLANGVALGARPSSNAESLVLGGVPFPGALANLRITAR